MGKLQQQQLAALIDGLEGQALHAYSLSFDHPITGKRLSFEAPMPADMRALIGCLAGNRSRSGKAVMADASWRQGDPAKTTCLRIV